ERVQLTDERERRTVTRSSTNVGADAREGEPGPRLEAEGPKRLLDETRGLDFLEAELGMAANPFADPHDLVGAPIDRVPQTLLQRRCVHGVLLARRRARRAIIADVRHARKRA